MVQGQGDGWHSWECRSSPCPCAGSFPLRVMVALTAPKSPTPPAALRDMYALHLRADLIIPGMSGAAPRCASPRDRAPTRGGLLARQHLTLEPTMQERCRSRSVGWTSRPAERPATYPCLWLGPTGLASACLASFAASNGVGYERFLHVTRTFFVDRG
jgi:hypothetical protein